MTCLKSARKKGSNRRPSPEQAEHYRVMLTPLSHLTSIYYKKNSKIELYGREYLIKEEGSLQDIEMQRNFRNIAHIFVQRNPDKSITIEVRR